MLENNLTVLSFSEPTKKLTTHFKETLHNTLYLHENTLQGMVDVVLGYLEAQKKQTNTKMLVICDHISQAIDFFTVVDGIVRNIAPNLSRTLICPHTIQVHEDNHAELNSLLAQQIIVTVPYVLNTSFIAFLIPYQVGMHTHLILNDANTLISHYGQDYFCQLKQVFTDAQILFMIQKKISEYIPIFAKISGGFQLVTAHNLSENSINNQSNAVLPYSDQPYLLKVDRNLKRNLLIQLILQKKWEKFIVVTRTKHAAHRLEEKLFHNKLRARIIHAGLPSSAIEKNVTRFNQGEINALILTDNALNLIEYPQLSAVIFFELPDVADDFFPRIDFFKPYLTNGENITLVCHDEEAWINELNQSNARQITLLNCDQLLPLIQNKPLKDTLAHKTNKRPIKQHTKKTKNTTPIIVNIGTQSAHSHKADDHTSQQTTTIHPKKHASANKLRRFSDKNKSESVEEKPKFPNKSPYKKTMSNSKAQPRHKNISEQQGVVNENRLPFEFDSFEANIARENKRRVRSILSGNSQSFKDPFEAGLFEQNSPPERKNTVKIIQKKRRNVNRDDTDS